MESLPSSSTGASSTARSSTHAAQLIMQTGKLDMAKIIHNELSTTSESSTLDVLLEVLLDPEEPIDSTETIEWCKFLIAGGRKPSDFASIGKNGIYFFVAQNTDELIWPHLQN